MAKAEAIRMDDLRTGTGIPVRVKSRKSVQGVVSSREPRASMQVLRSTKQWLDQIIDEKQFKTYDEAIMFLVTERQKHLPSDFGAFPDLKEYVCNGED
jgi:hypothetical protein